MIFFDKLTKNPNMKKKISGGGGGGGGNGKQMFQMGHFYSSRRTSVPN